MAARYRVAFAFTGEEEGELTVAVGEELTVQGASWLLMSAGFSCMWPLSDPISHASVLVGHTRTQRTRLRARLTAGS